MYCITSNLLKATVKKKGSFFFKVKLYLHSYFQIVCQIRFRVPVRTESHTPIHQRVYGNTIYVTVNMIALEELMNKIAVCLFMFLIISPKERR